MPTAQGEIKGNSDQFESLWIIDDALFQFRGKFSPSVERFQSSNATLEYDSTEDLSGSYVIDAAQPPSHVGKTDVALSFVNQDGRKVKITGSLSFPISEWPALFGQGDWIGED